MIPCYILVKDLLTWPREMAKHCVRLGLEPVLFDIRSQYGPLLEWYDSCDYRVIRSPKNASHYSVFHTITHRGFYIVTDPDLDISTVPEDCIEKLIHHFRMNGDVNKVGLSLEIEDIPDQALFSDKVRRWERKFWQTKRGDAWEANIGHTFALYHSTRNGLNFFKGIRLDRPYTARHLPWYLTLDDIKRDPELLHYFKNVRRHGPFWSNRIRDELHKHSI